MVHQVRRPKAGLLDCLRSRSRLSNGRGREKGRSSCNHWGRGDISYERWWTSHYKICRRV